MREGARVPGCMEPVTILVVDDDEHMLRVILRPLAACQGLRVREVLSARTPVDALALLDKAAPGPLVVVSDFNLKAAMNGLDVLDEVRRRRPDALRILMSGYSRDQLGPAVDAAPVHVFVEKAMRIHDTVEPMLTLIRERFAPA